MIAGQKQKNLYQLNGHDGMNAVLMEAVVWDLQSCENRKMIRWRSVGGVE